MFWDLLKTISLWRPKLHLSIQNFHHRKVFNLLKLSQKLVQFIPLCYLGRGTFKLLSLLIIHLLWCQRGFSWPAVSALVIASATQHIQPTNQQTHYPWRLYWSEDTLPSLIGGPFPSSQTRNSVFSQIRAGYVSPDAARRGVACFILFNLHPLRGSLSPSAHSSVVRARVWSFTCG